MANEIVTQTVQQWGNGLAVRLTAKIAKAARLERGQPITVEVSEQGILLKPAGPRRLTLEQKLALFDPKLHGGEAETGAPVGREIV